MLQEFQGNEAATKAMAAIVCACVRIPYGTGHRTSPSGAYERTVVVCAAHAAVDSAARWQER